MILIGWAVLGVVMGVVGSEVLRAKKPKLIRKVEGAAKHFVDSMYSEGSDNEDAAEDKDQHGAAR